MAKLCNHNPFQLKLTQLLFSLHYYCHHDLQYCYHFPHHSQRQHHQHYHHCKGIIFITIRTSSSSPLSQHHRHHRSCQSLTVRLSQSSSLLYHHHHCQSIIVRTSSPSSPDHHCRCTYKKFFGQKVLRQTDKTYYLLISQSPPLLYFFASSKYFLQLISNNHCHKHIQLLSVS